jgi:CRP-like cAMP-binding protein
LKKQPPRRGLLPKPATGEIRGHSVCNEILLELPRKECALLFSKLKPVDLKLYEVIQDVGERIKFVYFPNTGMASILNTLESGKSVEVGLAGKESFVGLALFAGFTTSANRVIIQGEGTAFRLDSQAFLEVLRHCPEMVRALLRYSQKAAMQVSQIAACNRFHDVEQRLARWLLMMYDRIGSDGLRLTQEFLGQILGTRRPTVSVAASTLQKAGLIRYTQGVIELTDRVGLEKASCECYLAMQQQIDHWNHESR